MIRAIVDLLGAALLRQMHAVSVINWIRKGRQGENAGYMWLMEGAVEYE
jgi:hypothetical protein